jgi:hypothetical protein
MGEELSFTSKRIFKAADLSSFIVLPSYDISERIGFKIDSVYLDSSVTESKIPFFRLKKC